MLFNTYVLCYVLTTSYNTSVEILHDTKKSRDRLISIHFILPETTQMLNVNRDHESKFLLSQSTSQSGRRLFVSQ